LRVDRRSLSKMMQDEAATVALAGGPNLPIGCVRHALETVMIGGEFGPMEDRLACDKFGKDRKEISLRYSENLMLWHGEIVKALS
jgi:hypothetical protein